MNDALLIYALPLLITAGLLLVVPASLAAPAQQHYAPLLTTLLLIALFSLLMIRLQSGTEALTASRIASTALAMLLGGLITAPLLDRARPAGLIVAAVATSIVIVPLFLHVFLPHLPGIYGVALLHALLIVGVLISLGGSMQLPLSESRFTTEGARRLTHIHSGTIAIGWVLVGIALAIAGWSMLPPDGAFVPLPLIASPIVASVMQLMTAKPHDALRKAGEGFAAGMLVVLMGGFTLEYAALAGIAAGFCVSRTEAISTSLRIDDAPHMIGVILLPSLLGITLPALLGIVSITAAISWLAVACGLGVVSALLLWPFIKLTIGLSIR